MVEGICLKDRAIPVESEQLFSIVGKDKEVVLGMNPVVTHMSH